jgi:UDP-N-acetylmuramate--L-alanine ligase/UDP-N-acetylenolpyruvoylglucosamine reductase
MQNIVEQIASGNARKHVHLLGVCGCGMSALAHWLAQSGHRVSGTDRAADNSAVAAKLRRVGVAVTQGHSAELTVAPDVAVYSAAIAPTNAELAALKRAGVPLARRGDFVASLVSARQGIAVAGTHGKTTTTAMIAHIFKRAGLKPSYYVGGEVPALGGSAERGAGDWFVAEADESDGTLASYNPQFGVILNIEEEHLDYYRDLSAIVSVFKTFASNVRGKLFFCSDDLGASRVCAEFSNAIAFGLSGGCEYGARHVKIDGGDSAFVVTHRGEPLGKITLRIPGAHNVSNALGAAAVALESGVTFDAVAAALGEFTGASRRFDRKFEGGGVTVVDDYAHHPTEVRATIAAARSVAKNRVVVAFQPHRYTRTRWLQHQFGSAFAMADKVFVTDVYAASEARISGVSGRTIFEAVRATGQRDVEYVEGLEELERRIESEAREGDLILMMGAGDITQVAEKVAADFGRRSASAAVAVEGTEATTRAGATQTLNTQHSTLNIQQLGVAEALRRTLSERAVVREREPMAGHTTLRVGGVADVWVEPADEMDLAAVVKFCVERGVPMTRVGRGSNLLVRDKGIRGVVMRLSHPTFSRLEIRGERIFAGAGVWLRSIANAARDASLTGVEFMEGIPASLGGALRMNAGAMGRATFDAVESLRYMDADGEVVDLRREQIDATYRRCALFTGADGAKRIALSAVLRCELGDGAVIQETMQRYLVKRRASQPNAPSAGCIFKNPSAQLSAGALIESLGLKGTRVGGAVVSEAHGNFIVTHQGARAADVLELIAMIRAVAKQARGVELETEVEILGEE